MKNKHTHSCKTFIRSYIRDLKRCLDVLDMDAVSVSIDMLMKAYTHGKKVFILGNGGSASTSSHMASDLCKGTLARVYDETERRFKVYSLTDNVAILTAFANDVSFEDVFVQQLRNLIEKDDVVIAISGSGNSPNVVKAVAYARSCKAKTIGLLGFKTGGKLKPMVDCAIVVDSTQYGPCEDIHLILDHIITSWIAKAKIEHDKNTA